jgi:hypothetical protein
MHFVFLIAIILHEKKYLKICISAINLCDFPLALKGFLCIDRIYQLRTCKINYRLQVF